MRTRRVRALVGFARYRAWGACNNSQLCTLSCWGVHGLLFTQSPLHVRYCALVAMRVRVCINDRVRWSMQARKWAVWRSCAKSSSFAARQDGLVEDALSFPAWKFVTDHVPAWSAQKAGDVATEPKAMQEHSQRRQA